MRKTPSFLDCSDNFLKERPQRVVVGGTFDRLHKGHEAVLEAAFAGGGKVVIGLTSDRYVQKFKSYCHPEFISGSTWKNTRFRLKAGMTDIAKFVNSYQSRFDALKTWLKKKNLDKRAEIVPIDDPLEPAASAKDFQAIVVTRETKAKAEEINRLRVKRGLLSLKLIEVPWVLAFDGNPISSSRLRRGEIDRKGRLVMPENLRKVLEKPLEKVLKGEEIEKSLKENLNKTVITVGDIAVKALIEAGITPALAVVDFRVGRQTFIDFKPKLKAIYKVIIKVKSGPGYISQTAKEAIAESLKALNTAKPKPRLVVVEGEEDLLVLPAVIYAPLGSIVYYGQPRLRRGKPHEGLAEVKVTKQKKQEIVELLEKFK